MLSEADVYKIGTLTRAHGIHGELAFQFTDDVWDRVEADFLFLRLDGLLVPFFLEEWRFRSDTTALLKFQDINSADEALPLVGADVCFPKALTPATIDEEDITWQMFTGFTVYQLPAPSPSSSPSPGSPSTSPVATVPVASPTGDPTLLGTVIAVMDQTANILLEVETPDATTILIPAHEDFILHADHQQRTLLVAVPQDLLTLNS